MSIADPVERNPMTSRLAQIIEEQALWYGVCDTSMSVAVAADIEGFRFTMGQHFHFSEWW
jgi:hypothetical protein